MEQLPKEQALWTRSYSGPNRLGSLPSALEEDEPSLRDQILILEEHQYTAVNADVVISVPHQAHVPQTPLT